MALALFSLNPQGLKINREEINAWMILQETLKQKIDGVKDTRQLILNFLQLFFKEKVSFGPRSIMLVSKDKQVHNIEPDDVAELQSIVQAVGGYFLISGANKGEQFNPANERAAKIAEKMKKAREKLAKVKANETGIAAGQANNFLTTMIAAVATMTANSLEQVNQMTLYQLNMIFKTYLNWEAYDQEVRLRLAGGGSKDDKIVHWTQAADSESSISTI